MGFLAEDRRLNVAVTRARRHIAVVCDSQTIKNHAFLKSLVDHITEFGETRTAFEYIQDIVPQNYTRDHKDTNVSVSAGSSTSVKQVQPSSKKKEVLKKSTNNSKENTANREKNTKPCTQAEMEQSKSRYTEIQERVKSFLKDPNQNHLQFPSSFNSHDRLLVHQIAEEMGLMHESTGEGKDRCTTVSRPQQSAPAEGTSPTEEIEEEKKEEPEKREETVEALNHHTLDLKSLHLERMRREQQKREENAQQKKHNVNLLPTQTQSLKKTKGWVKKKSVGSQKVFMRIHIFHVGQSNVFIEVWLSKSQVKCISSFVKLINGQFFNAWLEYMQYLSWL